MVRVSRKNFFNFAIGVLIGFIFSRSVYYERLFGNSHTSADIQPKRDTSADSISTEGVQETGSLPVSSPTTHTETSTTKTTSQYDNGAEPIINIDPLVPLRDPNEPCPYNSSDLDGLRKPPMAFRPTWREIDALMTKLNIKDGCSQPTDCISVERVAVIIPYKDREDHLVKWLWHMHKLLVRQRRNYCVFVSEPLGNGHFNKGSTMNSAVKEVIKRGFDCIVLHDVDMLLEDDHNIYQCEDNPVHLSPLIDKFKYKDHYGTEFGGVTMLKAEQYLKANGYSNLFWGWGKEDDDMTFRVHASGQSVRKPINYQSARYSMIPHQHPWAFRNNRLTDKESDLRFLSLGNIGNSKYRYKFEGVSSVSYQLTEQQEELSFTKLMVDFRPLDVLEVHIKSEGVLKMAMNPYQLADQGYLELNDTYICKDYGFASVMRWLGTWHASKGSATDKCDNFPDFCVGITRKGDESQKFPTDYTLREVSQLVSGATATQQDGCEPTAKEPVVFHKQIIGEQKRLHVIPDPIMQKKSETFSISVRYKNINGPSKGVYYRHALVWEGKAIKGVQHIELIPPLSTFDNDEKDHTLELEVTIDTPVPGWYTVLSKITDCIGQPMWELRWAFRVTTNQKEADDKAIQSTNISKTFAGAEWGLGIPSNVFKENLEKYYNVENTS